MQHAEALLTWFDRHRRDLPWRRTNDPYRIWLSEVMLQQTRVETVLPFYNRFLERFPTVTDLARAELEEVLALWSGLGYYRRARQLHAAAWAVAETGGELPRTVEGLMKLPGIGSYTAAAVASIAFGVAAPVLDGNVERVMARWLAWGEDPRTRASRQAFLEAAAGLLDPARPGDGNQALMELGATLCTPRRPRCLLCPLVAGCKAAGGGDPERYPAATPKREVEKHRWVAAVVEDGVGSGGSGGVLLFRRPEESVLLAGTWELPWVEEGPDPAAALAARYGGSWTLGPEVGRVRHGITFRDIEVVVYRATLAPGGTEVRDSGLEAGWFGERERAALPLSSLVGKVLAKLPGGEARPARPSGPASSRSRRRR
ncbi:MAG TPA: A/G-specific adenine glycosylase [Thermoanaerobaculia bacterium]|nr:A/G-specific adenine glycosylase [Thermoanaerobaculia bacterium]